MFAKHLQLAVSRANLSASVFAQREKRSFSSSRVVSCYGTFAKPESVVRETKCYKTLCKAQVWHPRHRAAISPRECFRTSSAGTGAMKREAFGRPETLRILSVSKRTLRGTHMVWWMPWFRKELFRRPGRFRMHRMDFEKPKFVGSA